jgi:ribose/xylose/arabinose/galactoside ABC-type transport system permease subunit
LIGKLKRSKSENLTLFIFMLATMTVISIFLPEKFLRLVNFQSMASQFPEYGLLALGISQPEWCRGCHGSGKPCRRASPGYFTRRHYFTCHPQHPGSLPYLRFNQRTRHYRGRGTGHHRDSGTILEIPMPLIIFIAVALMVSLMLKKSSQGFKMYMLGSSLLVSRFSGINVNRVLIKTYLLSGLLAGISAIIIISRVNSMRPGYGYAYLLLGVLIAILGGTNPEGGRGGVLGLCMAIVILQVLQSGLNILGFNPFYKKFIWGLILILVMVINYFQGNDGLLRNLVKKFIRSGAT